jgi:uncharacterized membrane protein YjjB (DUF3815 family)
MLDASEIKLIIYYLLLTASGYLVERYLLEYTNNAAAWDSFGGGFILLCLVGALINRAYPDTI